MNEKINIPASRAICDAASPAPWREGHTHNEIFAPGRIVAENIRPGDVAFAVHARTAFPRALNELEAAWKRIGELEQEARVDRKVIDDFIRGTFFGRAKYLREAAEAARVIHFMGHEILAVNAAPPLLGELVELLAQKQKPFSIGWSQHADGRYRYVLRSSADFDVSVIARYFGGDGDARCAEFEHACHLGGILESLERSTQFRHEQAPATPELSATATIGAVERILTKMSDGQVWSSKRLADDIGVAARDVAKLLNEMREHNLVKCVGWDTWKRVVG